MASDRLKLSAELLDYLLPILPPALLGAKNSAGSTPLHWAALNSQLGAACKLVGHPGSPGIDLIDMKNNAGRSPLAEAELAGWEEGAKWMVEVMKLDEAVTADEDERPVDATTDVEIEIEDADGQVARMSLGKPGDRPQDPTSV